MLRLAAALMAAFVCLTTSPLAARSPGLVAPDEIAIYVHSDATNTDFMDGLACELGRELVAPVRTAVVKLPLDRSYLTTPTQLSPRELVGPFVRATAADNPGRVFKFVVLPYDLKVQPFRYVFAETYLAPYDTSVMSTIRLQPRDTRLSRKEVADLTQERLYKLMLKAIARMAGLEGEGCILAFPRSLQELDRKSSEFCDDDRAALIDAGILKAKPVGSCVPIAMAVR
jgi:predicted Zn-dependent protease